MDRHALPLQPAEPDLSIEPVIGWRLWRLRRHADGRLTLVSPMQEQEWEPMRPTRARCRGAASTHPAPYGPCGCGLYAASVPGRLAAYAMITGRPAGVIGSVAMWGTVIEHQVGFRGELGYPDRIRLICARCVAAGRDGSPTRIFAGPGGELIPACEVHRRDAEPLSITPKELQLELRSTYAVELLPIETLRRAGFRSGAPETADGFGVQARSEARTLVRSRVGRLGIVAIVVVAWLVWRGDGSVTVPAGSPSSVTTTVDRQLASPFRTAGDPLRSPAPTARDRPSRFPLEFVCGHRTGEVVTLLRCRDERADLLGAAKLPPRPRRSCGMADGYKRKGRFCVCWIEVTDQVASFPTRPETWRLPGVRFEDVFS